MSVARTGLSLKSLRKIQRLCQEEVQTLTLAQLTGIGSSGDGQPPDQLTAATRTHREFKLRIAHRLRDFLFLPYKAMSNPSMRLVYDRYVAAYKCHEDFGELNTMDAAVEYWHAMAQIFRDNQHLTRQLGHGRRQLVKMDPKLSPILDQFFDHFFLSRIGTHLLGANYLHMCPVPQAAKKPRGVADGVLQPMNAGEFVRELAVSLRSSSPGRDFHSGGSAVDIEDSMDTAILYVPDHLRTILREILQNAMVASVRVATDRGCDPPNVKVKINSSLFGVFVTVSDLGGGIANQGQIWDWGPESERRSRPADLEEGAAWPAGMFGGAWPSVDVEMEAVARPSLLPLGFGLPLARLTARYFGGDVQIQSLVGYGTNAYIHIPELQQQTELGE